MDALEGVGQRLSRLACTEIGMLVQPGEMGITLLDTTELHAEAAVAWSLED